MSLRCTSALAAVIMLLSLTAPVASQVGVSALEAEYADLLALAGLVERPSLSYRTASAGTLTIPESGHPWAEGTGGGTAKRGGIPVELAPVEAYSSWNAMRPRGTNDGALWQGRGVNALLRTGLVLDTGWLYAAARPELVFSQNLPFETMPGADQNGADAAAADPYAYFWSVGVDAPQRFGEESLTSWSAGNSELRLTLPPLHLGGIVLDLPLTAGFGTEALWLGPALRNPILHSGNAPGYPRLDLGFGRTHTPLGDFELLTFWGQLQESGHFDTVSTNDHRLLTGLTFSVEPFFMPGLTLGIHRTMLSRWEDADYSAIFTLLDRHMSAHAGYDLRDQRATLSADYLIPGAGAEIYIEWGRNDYSTTFDRLLVYPFHSQAWTAGGRKLFRFPGDRLWSVVGVELSTLESSRDYEFYYPAAFYAHHIVRQGYTNEGQWLGAGIGTGANAQALSWSLFFPRGHLALTLERVSRDLDYVWFRHFGQPSGPGQVRYDDRLLFNATLDARIEASWRFDGGLRVMAGAAGYCDLNALYDPVTDVIASKRYDLSAWLAIGWTLQRQGSETARSHP